MEQDFSFLQTPVAWVIFAVTVAVSLIAFSNEKLYDRLILQPYNVSRGQVCLYPDHQRIYPCTTGCT